MGKLFTRFVERSKIESGERAVLLHTYILHTTKIGFSANLDEKDRWLEKSRATFSSLFPTTTNTPLCGKIEIVLLRKSIWQMGAHE